VSDGAAQENSIENTPNNWAKITPNTATAVAPGESVTFKGRMAMHNFGKSKCNFYILDGSGNVLSSKEAGRYLYSSYTDNTGYRSRDMVVSWENTTAATVNVKWEIRGWGYVATASRQSDTVVHIFVEGNGAGNYEYIDQAAVDGEDYSTFRVNYGGTPDDISFIKDSVIDNQSPSYELKDVKASPFGWNNTVYLYDLVFQTDPNAALKDEFYVGVNRPSRFIAEESLNVDYNITQIGVDARYANNVSTSHPGIIRFYPNGNEGSAVNIEVEGIQDYTSEVRLPVKISGGSRYFTIDGYDDSNLPNNRAEIRGRVVVRGEPIVKNNLT